MNKRKRTSGIVRKVRRDPVSNFSFDTKYIDNRIANPAPIHDAK